MRTRGGASAVMTVMGAGDIARDITAAIVDERWADLDRHVEPNAAIVDHRPGVADVEPTAAGLRDEVRHWCAAGPFELEVATVRGEGGPVTLLEIRAIVVAGYEITTLAVLAADDGRIAEAHLFDPHQAAAATATFEVLLSESGGQEFP